MSAGAWVVVVAVAAALAFGGYRLLADGRFRGTRPVVELRGAQATSLETTTSAAGDDTAATTWTHIATALGAVEPGARATLVQFSSAFCAPCRATRRTLGEVAALVPGVEHVEIDAEQHLELVRTLGILRTPTTLVLDETGREVTRATGAPRKEQVLGALGTV